MQNSAPMSTTTTDPRDVIARAHELIARAYDREDSAQRGEPDPWTLEPDDAEWRAERLACAGALIAALTASGLSIVPVGELVRELREHDELVSIAGEDYHEKPEICERAASTLESLAAENARLKEELGEAVVDKDRFFRQMRDNANRAEAAEAANAELRAALEPFAKMANELEHEPSWRGVLEHDHPLAGRVDVSDFRRAASLLRKGGADV